MKQRIIFLFILLSVIIFTGCSNKSKGYSDLDVLYQDFVVKLKASPEQLKEYCMKITPDKGTIAYMKKNNFSYRGLPDDLERQKLDVTMIGEDYNKLVMEFRKDLINNNHLDNLEYIGREQQGEELYNKELGIMLPKHLY